MDERDIEGRLPWPVKIRDTIASKALELLTKVEDLPLAEWVGWDGGGHEAIDKLRCSGAPSLRCPELVEGSKGAALSLSKG